MNRLTRVNPSRETKFSGTHGDGGMFIFPVQLTTTSTGNLTRLIHTLLYVMTIHTYIRTYIVWMNLATKTVYNVEIVTRIKGCRASRERISQVDIGTRGMNLYLLLACSKKIIIDN